MMPHMRLTARGWRAARMVCIGDGMRGCIVVIQQDKPGMRCEFCRRTVRLREPVA